MRIANTLLVTGAALVAGLAFSAKPAAAALLLLGNDFESGQTIDQGGGSLSTDQSHSATHSWSTPDANWAAYGYTKTLALPTLQPGESFGSFVLNAWVYGAEADQYRAKVMVTETNGGWQTGVETTLTDWAPTTAGAWSEIAFDLADPNLTPNNINTLYNNNKHFLYKITLQRYGHNPPHVDNPAYIDDISINYTVVPEPASLSLLGLGGLMLTGRRRKRA